MRTFSLTLALVALTLEGEARAPTQPLTRVAVASPEPGTLSVLDGDGSEYVRVPIEGPSRGARASWWAARSAHSACA